MMTYASAVAYLYGLQKQGIRLGLETMTALVGRLGNPHTGFRALHIAGTNGKGSTAAMAAAILQEAGYRVGLYTSPHLVEFRERIRVNGEMISEQQVARLTDQLKGICEPDLSPTFFECTTAMAFQHFLEQTVDVAVLEVGLGGRFDATNIVLPEVCAITTIALDHQEYLGTTLESIAFEKAGIIKPHVPVVLGRISEQASRTIQQVASDRVAHIHRLGHDFMTEGCTPDRFTYSGLTTQYRELSCPLQGFHQLDNAACALSMLEAAGSFGLIVSEQAVRDGLLKVHWEGRLEVVEQQPIMLLDGAHNPAAAAALARYLCTFRLTHPASRVILVLGIMRDKDHRGFVEPLRGLVDEVILTQADLPRAATVQELRINLGEMCPQAHLRAVISDALGFAKQLAKTDDLICITGSLMLIGDVKALLHGCGLSPLRG